MPMEVGPPSGGGVGGIPTKYLIIGAGALGLGFILLMQRSAGASAASGDVQPTGSVSAELSSVQQMQLQQFGELTKLFAAQSDLIGSSVGGLSNQLDTQAANLSSSIATSDSDVQAAIAKSSQSLSDSIASGNAATQTAVGNLATGQQQIYGQNAANFQTIMQGIWQTFMRASNPYADISQYPTPENVAQGSFVNSQG